MKNFRTKNIIDNQVISKMIPAAPRETLGVNILHINLRIQLDFVLPFTLAILAANVIVEFLEILEDSRPLLPVFNDPDPDPVSQIFREFFHEGFQAGADGIVVNPSADYLINLQDEWSKLHRVGKPARCGLPHISNQLLLRGFMRKRNPFLRIRMLHKRKAQKSGSCGSDYFGFSQIYFEIEMLFDPG